MGSTMRAGRILRPLCTAGSGSSQDTAQACRNAAHGPKRHRAEARVDAKFPVNLQKSVFQIEPGVKYPEGSRQAAHQPMGQEHT